MKRFDDKRIGYWHLNAFIALNAPLIFLILLKNTWQSHQDVVSWTYLISVSLGYYVLTIYIIASLSYLVLSPIKKIAAVVSVTLVTMAVYYLS